MANVSNSEYWQERTAKRMEEYQKDADETIQKTLTAFDNAQKSLDNDIQKILSTFAEQSGLDMDQAKELMNAQDTKAYIAKATQAVAGLPDEAEKIKKLTLAQINQGSYKARITRLEALKLNINSELINIAKIENTKATEGILQTIDKAYHTTMYDLQQEIGLGFDFAKMSTKQAQEILKNPWSGSHYSTNIWNNVADTAAHAEKVLMEGFMTGKSAARMATQLNEAVGQERYKAARIIRTEATYAANSAKLQAMKEAGATEVKFLAIEDTKTSDLCQNADGKIIPIDQARAGKNIPPLHPNCRSTITRVWDIPGLTETTKRVRDPETGQNRVVPAGMTYEDWKAIFVDKTQSYDEWAKKNATKVAQKAAADAKIIEQQKAIQEAIAAQKAAEKAKADAEAKAKAEAAKKAQEAAEAAEKAKKDQTLDEAKKTPQKPPSQELGELEGKTYTGLFTGTITPKDFENLTTQQLNSKKQYLKAKIKAAKTPAEKAKWEKLLDDFEDFKKNGQKYVQIKKDNPGITAMTAEEIKAKEAAEQAAANAKNKAEDPAAQMADLESKEWTGIFTKPITVKDYETFTTQQLNTKKQYLKAKVKSAKTPAEAAKWQKVADDFEDFKTAGKQYADLKKAGTVPANVAPKATKEEPKPEPEQEAGLKVFKTKEEAAKEGYTYTGKHVTDKDAAEAIRKEGFKNSEVSTWGPGVYLSTDKATDNFYKGMHGKDSQTLELAIKLEKPLIAEFKNGVHYDDMYSGAMKNAPAATKKAFDEAVKKYEAKGNLYPEHSAFMEVVPKYHDGIIIKCENNLQGHLFTSIGGSQAIAFNPKNVVEINPKAKANKIGPAAEPPPTAAEAKYKAAEAKAAAKAQKEAEAKAAAEAKYKAAEQKKLEKEAKAAEAKAIKEEAKKDKAEAKYMAAQQSKAYQEATTMKATAKKNPEKVIADAEKKIEDIKNSFKTMTGEPGGDQLAKYKTLKDGGTFDSKIQSLKDSMAKETIGSDKYNELKAQLKKLQELEAKAKQIEAFTEALEVAKKEKAVLDAKQEAVKDAYNKKKDIEDAKVKTKELQEQILDAGDIVKDMMKEAKTKPQNTKAIAEQQLKYIEADAKLIPALNATKAKTVKDFQGGISAAYDNTMQIYKSKMAAAPHGSPEYQMYKASIEALEELKTQSKIYEMYKGVADEADKVIAAQQAAQQAASQAAAQKAAQAAAKQATVTAEDIKAAKQAVKDIKAEIKELEKLKYGTLKPSQFTESMYNQKHASITYSINASTPGSFGEKYYKDKLAMLDGWKANAEKYQDLKKQQAAQEQIAAQDPKKMKKIAAKEAEIKDYEDKLQDLEDSFSYSNIWKETVTPADYPYKKGSIAAKKQYFESAINSSMTSATKKVEFENLINALEEFEEKGQEYEALLAQATKSKMELHKLHPTNNIPDGEAYSQSRKDAAKWFKTQKPAHDYHLPILQKAWANATMAEKTAAYTYTHAPGQMNRPLRGIKWGGGPAAPGKIPLNAEGAEHHIKALKSIISKSVIPDDMWVNRGIQRNEGAAPFLGIKESDFNLSQQQMEQLVLGKPIHDYGFVSTSPAKGKGFSGIKFNIYCPKGTEALYVEPISAYGMDFGPNWDGKQTYNRFGGEFEIILQAGYEFRVIKVEKQSNYEWYFDIEIIGKAPDPGYK